MPPMTRTLDTPEAFRAAILDEVVREERATEASLALIDEALRRFPESVKLWCLHGDLLQLCVEDEERGLEQAGDSYLRAAELEPANPEPYESLGHFFDAVMDDPQQAAEYFRKAITLGAGESAREGLAEALAQLDE
jgi:Flp pilus assembly protein TadD